MKRKVYIIVISVLMMILSLVGLSACQFGGTNNTPTTPTIKNKGEWTITSPDETLTAELVFDAYSQLTIAVKKGDTVVLNKSKLGLDIEEDDLNFINIHRQSSRKIKGSYENISGRTAHVDYACSETTVTFKSWEFYLDVVVRVYNDGYAFRYNVRKLDGSEGMMTVKSENTEFAFPENANMWAQEYVSINNKGDFFAYEVAYQKKYIPGLSSSQYMAFPVIYEIPGTKYYSLLNESELIGSNFYGSYLKAPEGTEGQSILKTEHTPAGITLDDNQVPYPFTSPWRMGIVGDMKTIQESELTETLYYSGEEDYTDVYWKPDNYDELSDEEKAIYTYDWVEPGITAWNWLKNTGNRPQSDFNLHREYITLAKEMGWKYLILDGGWNGSLNETSFLGFMNEANKAGVKIIVWCNALADFGNGNIDILKSKLDQWQSWGIAGIKIDFFDGQNATDQTHQGEDIGTIKWYESIYQECAKRKMIVNCHGSNKPTGERAKYPNVINREAIYGNEMKGVGPTFTINQLFIRNVVGPSDFTPVLDPLSANISKAHQMALAVLFESGTPSMADIPSAYRDIQVYSFFKSLSATREKTLYLDGKLDRYYAAAIKTEKHWFVGAVNSLLETDITIDFSFLDDGEYTVEVFTDGSSLKEMITETFTVTKNDQRQFTLKEKGGLAIRITKK